MGTSRRAKNGPVRLFRAGRGRLLDGADGAYRAGFGGGDGLGHVLAGDVAGDGHGQRPIHRKDFGAQAGALGAADAEIGVNDRFHGIASFGSYCTGVCPPHGWSILSGGDMLQ